MLGRARVLLASVLAASALACSALTSTDGLSGGESSNGGSAHEDATSPSAENLDAARPDDATSLVDAKFEVDAGSDAAGSDAATPRTTCLPGAPSLALAPRRGATAVNVVGSGQGAWTNPSRALTLDGLSATIGLAYNSSDELLVTQFYFPLPSSAVALTGLEVVVTRWSRDGEIKDGKVRFYLGAFPTGVDHAVTSFWPKVTGIIQTYGSASDTWGISLADVTAADSASPCLRACRAAATRLPSTTST